MILDTFTLSGKVAIVTGCDTGLGQGMAIALAQAGCDIGQRDGARQTVYGHSGRPRPAGESSGRCGACRR